MLAAVNFMNGVETPQPGTVNDYVNEDILIALKTALHLSTEAIKTKHLSTDHGVQ